VRAISIILLKLEKKIERAYFLFFPEVWIISGKEKISKEDFKIFYSGYIKHMKYIKRHIFSDGASVSYFGRVFFIRLKFLHKRNRNRCNLAIIEGNNKENIIYNAIGNMLIPIWVNLTIELPIKVKSKSLKSDIRNIKRQDLKYRISLSKKDMNIFLDDLHIPMLKKIYSDEADIIDENFDRKLEKNKRELLLIKKDNRIMAGGLIERRGKIPKFLLNGIIDVEERKKSIMTSIYLFISEYLYSENEKYLSLGNSHGFIDDGLFQYKTKFSTYINKSETWKHGWNLKLLLENEGLKGFFMNHSFLYWDLKENLLCAALFDGESKNKMLSKVRKIKGIDRIKSFGFSL